MAVELVKDEGAAADPVDGFFGVTLWLADPGPTARLLTQLFGYAEVGEERAGTATRLLLRARDGGRDRSSS